MESILASAFLTLATFVAIAVASLLITGLTSTPKDGQLHPKFSPRTQYCAIIACLFIVPVLHRFFDPYLTEQEQVNSILISMNLLLAICMFALLRDRNRDGTPDIRSRDRTEDER